MFSRNNKESKRYLKMAIDLLAIAAQATGFVVWPLLEGNKTPELWLIPVTVFLISCGWWENYVTKDSPFSMIKSLGRIGERLKRTRYFTYIFISIWKMVCFFGSLVLIVYLQGQSVTNFFTHFDKAFSAHDIIITEVSATDSPSLKPHLVVME